MHLRSDSNSVQIGIDLGTTNSVVAYMDQSGQPTSLVNLEGDVLTPSKVLIDEQVVIVGREATKAAGASAERYADCFKRHMGEDHFPQQIGGSQWRPELLSAMVLKRLHRDAVQRLGGVTGAVITVPAYFIEGRRRATTNAAVVAGVEVVDLINEPTAAAIAYAWREGRLGTRRGEQENILVFDLGGGTLDVTILRVAHGAEYRTLATDGEVQLGGHDWDSRLRGFIADEFTSQTGYNPLTSAQGRFELLQLAERIKHTLSTKQVARAPCLFRGHRAIVEVSRANFERLTADLVERSRVTAELVREQAKMVWADIDRVLLIGGSTRMPMIHRMIQQLTDKVPDTSMSVDEAVAHGAAIYAHLKRSTEAIHVVNVNSHSYRVLAARPHQPRIAFPLILKNSELPARAKHVFRVANAAQLNCCITVCEGDSDDPQFCSIVGKVVVDLCSESRKRWLVAVTLLCMQDGNLMVKASIRDPDAHVREVSRAVATLVPSQGMTPTDVSAAQQLLATLQIM